MRAAAPGVSFQCKPPRSGTLPKATCVAVFDFLLNWLENCSKHKQHFPHDSGQKGTSQHELQQLAGVVEGVQVGREVLQVGHERPGRRSSQRGRVGLPPSSANSRRCLHTPSLCLSVSVLLSLSPWSRIGTGSMSLEALLPSLSELWVLSPSPRLPGMLLRPSRIGNATTNS